MFTYLPESVASMEVSVELASIPDATRHHRRSAHELPDEHPAKRMLVECEDAFSEAFFLPNVLRIDGETFRLKRPFRDRKNKGRSLAGIRKMQAALAEKADRVSAHKIDKASKECRIRDYAAQVECETQYTGEIQFNENEDRLYNAQLRFCRILGLVKQEDIDGIDG